MREFRSGIVCLALVGVVATAQAPAAVPYESYVARAHQDWGVPGVAIGIVKDGKVVLLRGFGVRTVGKPEKVDARTLFPIASLTKGFTAAAVASLVADGVLAWDDRVVDRLPGFAVKDPELTRALTLRDLGVHRSGLSERAEWLWQRTALDGRAVLERMKHLEAGPPFRAAPAYLNTTYLVLGEAAAASANTSWEELVRTRLFTPLGFEASVTDLAAMTASGNFATPHVGDAPPFRAIPPEPVRGVRPAAGIASNAEELVRWIQLFLGRGEVDGKRVLASEAIDELLRPQQLIPFGPVTRRQFPSTHVMAYGLGWLLQDHRGRLVAWNTGGLEGVSCSIALVPEERFGVVVLANYGRTGFPEALVWRAIDEALGGAQQDWSAVKLQLSLDARARARAREAESARRPLPEVRPALALARYAGRYVEPLLGELALRAKGGALEVDWNGRRGRAEPWQGETFRIAWDGATPESQRVTFVVTDGVASGLTLEEAGDFTRAP